MDLTLERAAADLYATPWKTFRFVTLPLLWPGILAGLMLAFVISLDDVVITEFVKSGGQDTLPTYMLGQLRRGDHAGGERHLDHLPADFGGGRDAVLFRQQETRLNKPCKQNSENSMKLTWHLAVALLAIDHAAQAEGVLNIYNWGNYTNPEHDQEVRDQIQRQGHDHGLRFKRHGAGQGRARAATASISPCRRRATCRSGSPKGLLLETNPGQMENVKNIAPEWADPDFDPGRKYTVPWQHGTIGIAVNTDVYKGPLDTWAIIFDPPEELKGKINVVPEMSDVIYAAIAYNGGELCAPDDRQS